LKGELAEARKPTALQPTRPTTQARTQLFILIKDLLAVPGFLQENLQSRRQIVLIRKGSHGFSQGKFSRSFERIARRFNLHKLLPRCISTNNNILTQIAKHACRGSEQHHE